MVQNYANPQTLNRYNYYLNNPLKYINPYGHLFWFAIPLIEFVEYAICAVVGYYTIKFAKENIDRTQSSNRARATDNSGNATNADPNDKLPTKKDLSKKAGEPDPADKGGQYTRAGRALQKHGGRSGSAFEQATGNPQEINQQGQRVVDDILNGPDTTIGWNNKGNIEVRALDGRGIEYYPDGTMRGFLEP